jgi:Kef-type K+ transport system membrane component KefB
MSARRLGNLLGLIVLLCAGIYVFVYLYRWEWNRALFVAILFVATEVAIVANVLLQRMSTLANANRILVMEDGVLVDQGTRA